MPDHALRRAALLSAAAAFLVLGLSPSQALSQDGAIPYQSLARENFKGRPDPASPQAALSYVQVTMDIKGSVAQRPDGSYEARITTLTYKSMFNENRSWWKPSKTDDRLLDHEQGHFNLVEIKVRQWNADKRRVMATLTGRGADADQATAALRRAVATHLEGRQNEIVRLGQLYDDETDYSRDAKKQREWSRRIRRTLSTGQPLW